MKDTTPEVEARYLERLLELTPVQRARRGFQMRSFVRKCARKGIRAQYPSWSEREVEIELFRRLYSDDLGEEQLDYWQERLFKRSEASHPSR